MVSKVREYEIGSEAAAYERSLWNNLVGGNMILPLDKLNAGFSRVSSSDPTMCKFNYQGIGEVIVYPPSRARVSSTTIPGLNATAKALEEICKTKGVPLVLRPEVA